MNSSHLDVNRCICMILSVGGHLADGNISRNWNAFRHIYIAEYHPSNTGLAYPNISFLHFKHWIQNKVHLTCSTY